MSAEQQEPKRSAVALRYDENSGGAPGVVAKGKGSIAERILALAKEHDIPIHEDADLLEMLAVSEVGHDIPLDMYEVVAELLHYLYQLNGSLSSR